MMQPGNSFNRRHLGAAIAAVFVLATAFVVEFASRRRPDPSRPKFTVAPPLLSGLAPGSSLTEAKGEGDDGDMSPPDQAARSEGDATIEGFLKLLGGSTPEPKARAVGLALTEEFKKVPALRKAHEEFLKLPPEKRKPREFLARVGKMPEFQRLVARFMSSPGIGGMLPAFAGVKARDINQIVRDWKAKGASGIDVNKVSAASGRAEPRPVLPGGAGAASRFGAGAGDSGAMQAVGARAFGGVGPHAGVGAHGSLAPIPQPREGADGDGGRDKGAGGGGGPAAGAEAHRVDTEFKPLAVVQGDDWNDPGARRKLIEAFLIKMDPAKRAAVQALLEAGTENLWSACFMTNNFTECLRVCRDPEVNCSAKGIPVPASAWDACNHRAGQDPARHTPFECVALCVDRRTTGCAADEAVRLDGCEGMNVGCEYCNNRQYGWKTVCGGTPQTCRQEPRYANEVCSPINDGTGPAGPPAAAPSSLNPYPMCSTVGGCNCCYNGSGNFECDVPSGCNRSYVCPASGPRPAPASDAPNLTASNQACNAYVDPTDGVNFNWGVANEARHRLVMANPPDEKGSMEQINLMLRYSPNDDYVMNILGGWNIGTSNDAAVNSMLGFADKYGKENKYLEVAAYLRAAGIRAATTNGDAADLYRHVIDLAKKNPNMEAYSRAAQAALDGAPPPPACPYGKDCGSGSASPN